MTIFPNVPIAPGVPPVLRLPGIFPAPVVPIKADSPQVAQVAQSKRWGIFDQSNKAVLTVTSTVSMEYAKDWRISDYQQEQGAFTSYNKVATPFAIKLTFTKQGNASARHAFLAQVKSVAQSLSLYNVVTPDDVYQNCNVEHWDFQRRNEHGVTMLTIDIWLIEIRVSGTASFTQTPTPASTASPGVAAPQSPTAANPVNLGNLQPVTPSPTQTQSVTATLQAAP